MLHLKNIKKKGSNNSTFETLAVTFNNNKRYIVTANTFEEITSRGTRNDSSYSPSGSITLVVSGTRKTIVMKCPDPSLKTRQQRHDLHNI